MSRVCYFMLLIALILQDFTILCAIPPVPAPTYAPAYTPTYAPAYVPTLAPKLTPMPTPFPPSPSNFNNGDTPPSPPSPPSSPSVLPDSPAPQSAKSKGGSKGMSGGQKVGLAFGVIAGAALVGFGGMVYVKRRKNIRRSRFINSVQLSTPFRKLSP